MDRKHTKTIIIIMAAIIFALLVAVGILLVNAAKIPMPAECPPSVRWDGQVYAYRGEKLSGDHAAAEVLGNITAACRKTTAKPTGLLSARRLAK